MTARMMSLAVTPGRSVALDGDRHGLERLERQRLGGQHVLDLAGADAEGHRPEGAVGGGVRVAADDGDARHASGPAAGRRRARCPARCRRASAGGCRTRSALARSVSICVRLIGSAMGRSIARVGVLWSSVAIVRSGRRTGRPAMPQAVEGLRAGDLVHEVQVDVDEVGRAVLALGDQVVVPDLLGQGARGVAHDAGSFFDADRPTCALECASPRRVRPGTWPRRGDEGEVDRTAWVSG